MVDLTGKIKIFGYSGSLAVGLDIGYRLLHGAVMTEIYFQSLFLGPLGGVGPVTFRRFLDAIDIGVLAAAYPHLFEVVASLLVIEGVDCEYLLLLNRCQSEYGRYVAVPVLELRLVEQYLHIGVVDYRLFYDGRVYHIVKLLCHHTGYAVELADGLIQELYVLRHSGRGYRFPCLLDYQGLATFLDTHFLEKNVHDYQHNDREKHRVVFNLVDFKDYETLVEKNGVEVGVESDLQFAATVELFEDSGEVAYVEMYLLQRCDLRYSFKGELVIGVEGERRHFEAAFLLLHVVYLPVNLHKHRGLVQFFLIHLNL